MLKSVQKLRGEQWILHTPNGTIFSVCDVVKATPQTSQLLPAEWQLSTVTTWQQVFTLSTTLYIYCCQIVDCNNLVMLVSLAR